VQIDHLVLPVSSYTTGKRFYERALAPLGFSVRMDWPDRHRAYFGLPGEPSSIWLFESPSAGSLELALRAPDARIVESFHDAAVGAGARSLHAPAIDSDRHGDHYSARVVDPDGNRLEVVFHSAAQEASLAA
jgi:catechol 2,3-dioxygenase-like lactoylglutathione lyase family enzyme